MAKTDKSVYERAKRAERARMTELRKQFEFGASADYQGEPFVRVLVEQLNDAPEEFEPYEDVPTAPVQLGELHHTPVRDATPGALREPPVDAVIIEEMG